MTFSSILRKTYNLTPLVNRVVQRSNRSYVSAVDHSNFSRTKLTVVPFIQQCYSTAADSRKPTAADSLLRAIDSEIKIAQETDDHERVEAIPQGFPFKIDDNAGKQTVILTREHDGELVKIEVHMPDLVTGDDNEIGDDTGDDIEKPTRSSIPLFVTVSKKNGTFLEFHCVAYPDEIAIESLSIKNPELSEDQIAYGGPNFQDLDEKLRNAFHKYLEIRGIKPSTTNFLHEYMINKDSREYLGWLKDLRQFVEA